MQMLVRKCSISRKRDVHMSETAWIFCSQGQYHITHDFDDDLCDILFEERDVFEVDERIAEPVAMLCNKGYITDHSCSGHPFPICSYDMAENEQDIEVGKYVATYRDSNTGEWHMCYLEEKIDDDMYISFIEPYKFDSFPKGWRYESQGVLRKHIHAESRIDFFKQSITSIETLTDWIKHLPKKEDYLEVKGGTTL